MRIALLSLGFLSVLNSCVEPEAEESAIRHEQLDDVPAPSGFEFVPDPARSYSFASGSYRRARLEYHGGGTTIEGVLDFYANRLPEHGWGRQQSPDNGSSAVFVKGRQRLHVAVEQVEVGSEILHPLKLVVSIESTSSS